jgi:hypothetical protein
MRTVRLSMAGALILGLLGGIPAVTVAQSDAPATTESALLSDTMPYPIVTDPTPYIFEEDRVLVRDYGFGGTIDTGDPRLSGESWAIWNDDRHLDSQGSVVAGLIGIDNELGSWRGTFRGYTTANNARIYLLSELAGEGAYEGLSAILFQLDNGSGFDLEGMVYPGELPPFPDAPGAEVAAAPQEETDAVANPLMVGSAEGEMVADLENPAGCEIGFTSVMTATGESTLLGPTSVVFQNCYAPEDVLANMHGGTTTFSNDAGDSITVAGPGDCIPSWVEEVGAEWICVSMAEVTGGTGQFEGASGQISFTGTVTNSGYDEEGLPTIPHPVSIVFEGLVEY